MRVRSGFAAWLGAVGAAVAGTTLPATAATPAMPVVPTLPAYIEAVVTDPTRPANQRDQDDWRRPAAVIAFAGIKPGDRVADFMSGNGYFTRLLSRVVGSEGRVYAFLPTQELARCAPEETAGTQSLHDDKNYPNVRVMIERSDQFSAPELLDVVWTAQNYHDLHDKFMSPTDVATLNAAVFKALKPGGIFLVIDHAAAAGSGLRDTETLHRIDPQTVRSEVMSAGFVFESQSEVLRNPDDSHALTVFDPAIRHRTDQFVFKFRKPGGLLIDR